MKREDWQAIEQRLVYPGAQAKLTVDGYGVTLEVHRHKMRMEVMVFVGGVCKGEWISKDCEERRRFFRPVTHRPKPAPPKEVKLLGKKWCDAQRAKYTHTYYLPLWPSVGALRRHFEKHNSSVELAQPETA